MPDVYIWWAPTKSTTLWLSCPLSSIKAEIGKIRYHPAAGTRQYDDEVVRKGRKDNQPNDGGYLKRNKRNLLIRKSNREKEKKLCMKRNKGKNKVKSQHSLYPHRFPSREASVLDDVIRKGKKKAVRRGSCVCKTNSRPAAGWCK